MKYRDKYDILTSILETTLQSAGKTKIVYNCNLNFTVVKSHLDLLITSKCLSLENDKYLITNRGKDLLNKLKTIKYILNGEDQL